MRKPKTIGVGYASLLERLSQTGSGLLSDCAPCGLLESWCSAERPPRKQWHPRSRHPHSGDYSVIYTREDFVAKNSCGRTGTWSRSRSNARFSTLPAVATSLSSSSKRSRSRAPTPSRSTDLCRTPRSTSARVKEITRDQKLPVVYLNEEVLALGHLVAAAFVMTPSARTLL